MNGLGAQPFSQHRFVHGNAVEQPIMADVVEAACNVALQYPGRTRTAEAGKTAFDSVSTVACLLTLLRTSNAAALAQEL